MSQMLFSHFDYSVEDLGAGVRDTRPPGPKFLHFHADFGKNWLNNMLAPPGVGRLLWKFLDLPLLFEAI